MSGNSAPEHPSAAPIDRRRWPRKRVVLRGKVVYNEGAYTADCLIRNLSDRGAYITVDRGVSIPTHVYLIDIRAGLAHAAEVASIRTNAFGLHFLRTLDLSSLSDPTLKYLKYCWEGCAR
jgi:hypothetical protein